MLAEKIITDRETFMAKQVSIRSAGESFPFVCWKIFSGQFTCAESDTQTLSRLN